MTLAHADDILHARCTAIAWQIVRWDKSEIRDSKSEIPSMSSPFATHEHHEFLAASHEALGSPNLQLALSRLGETLAAGNRTAFEKLPGSSLLRDKARAIKDETLAHLDAHLEQ